jgi:diaminopimelate decarboxylase
MLNNGLGFKNHNTEIIGNAGFYPYYSPICKEEVLRAILTSKYEGKTIHHHFKSNNIEIRIEPGRSSLDQCGVTLAKVVFRKHDSNDDLLVGLDMNMTQLMSSSTDFLVDPVILYQNKPKSSDSKFQGYFVGAYCMERDVILKRKIEFLKKPEPGDIVCFINTAGYMMHFLESQAHQFERAVNLVILSGNDHFKFIKDFNS